LFDDRILPPWINASTAAVNLRVLNSQILHYPTTHIGLARLNPTLTAFVRMASIVALKRITRHVLIGYGLI
jgi:hypothetical protein